MLVYTCENFFIIIFYSYFVGVEMMPVLQEVNNEGSRQAQYPHVEDTLRTERWADYENWKE